MIASCHGAMAPVTSRVVGHTARRGAAAVTVRAGAGALTSAPFGVRCEITTAASAMTATAADAPMTYFFRMSGCMEVMVI
jgi:hypothetical protein